MKKENVNEEKPRKKKVVKYILGISVVIVILILFFASRSIYGMLPTTGEEIAKYDNPKSAIIVIDVQNGTTQTEQYQPSEELINNINSAIEYGVDNDMEIIYIVQEYNRNPWDQIVAFGKFTKGTDSVILDDRLDIVSEVKFTKNRSDTFSNSDFEEYLVKENIDTIYLLGVDAYACVMRTAQGGVNRGYGVIAVKDCIGTQMANGAEGAFTVMDSLGVEIVDSIK